MTKIKLIHWKPEELEDRASKLRAAGYHVDASLDSGPRVFKTLTKDPPAAIVIDLSRLPSQGRDFAIILRSRKSTREIPIVFVEGDSAKVESIRELLPDATYTTWDQVSEILPEAIANPPTDPIVYESAFAGYAGKPLFQKLGIKPAMSVSLINSPPGFEHLLEGRPPSVKLVENSDLDSDLTIYFCRSAGELGEQIEDIVRQSQSGPVWIAWPKQKSGLSSDLTQQIVRQMGLDCGLVDYKICSFDETWSGLLFKFRGKV
jgi:CheY-like chemotaxis protein